MTPILTPAPGSQQSAFASFCGTIDTNGGNQLLCIVVILIGVAILRFAGLHEGVGLIIGGSSALFMAMKAKGAENHDTGAPTSVRVSQSGEVPAISPTVKTESIETLNVKEK